MNTIRRINPDISTNKNKFSKSKSPECLRQKIPPFKPKKLQEIFQESKCKKSTASYEKLISNKDKFSDYQLKQSQEDELRFSSPANLQKAKNSLADFIKDSGHCSEIESLEFQASQLDDKMDGCQFNGFRSQQRKPTLKLQFRVFTPQCQTFSKLRKQGNPFAFRDDSAMSSSQDPKSRKYWNGEITLATSMCQDEFENEKLNEKMGIPQQLRMFIDDKSFYVFCINQKSENQILLQSTEPFIWTTLKERLVDLQKTYCRNQPRVVKRQKQQLRIKIVQIQQIDQFLTKNLSQDQLQNHLSTQILPKYKYISITYKVESSFKPREKIK